MTTIKRVHVIFKTHLDIGYTYMAEHVIERYMKQFIPQALNLSEQLAQEDGNAKFVWTTGSWLIHKYLNTADADMRACMEEAIRQGRIAWHVLPLTTHTELMDVKLFDFGLSLSRELDRKFDKTTIAAKMTDVPGHTIAMVDLGAKRHSIFAFGRKPGMQKSACAAGIRMRVSGDKNIYAYAAEVILLSRLSRNRQPFK